MRAATAECVQDAADAGEPAGPACAVPRERALDTDPAVLAARPPAGRASPSPTSTRCCATPARCPPVIGGALVYKDEDHFTPVFAATLAPYLRRELRRAGLSA